MNRMAVRIKSESLSEMRRNTQNVSKALPTVDFVLTYHHENHCVLGVAKAKAGRIKRHEIHYAEVNHYSKEVSCG